MHSPTSFSTRRHSLQYPLEGYEGQEGRRMNTELDLRYRHGSQYFIPPITCRHQTPYYCPLFFFVPSCLRGDTFFRIIEARHQPKKRQNYKELSTTRSRPCSLEASPRPSTA